MYLIGIIRGQHLFVHTIWTIESDTTSLWARSLQSIVQFNELWANSGCTEMGNHCAIQSSKGPSYALIACTCPKCFRPLAEFEKNKNY